MCVYIVCVYMYIQCTSVHVHVYMSTCAAIKAKCDRRLEAEQKRRAKFRTEVLYVLYGHQCSQYTCAVCVCVCVCVTSPQAEEKVKVFVGDDDKELSFPKVAKVYPAIFVSPST